MISSNILIDKGEKIIHHLPNDVYVSISERGVGCYLFWKKCMKQS